eukprot:gene19410-23207_t
MSDTEYCNSSDEQEDAFYYPDLRKHEFDLFKTLKVQRPHGSDAVTGGHTRLRAAYHKLVMRHHPSMVYTPYQQPEDETEGEPKEEDGEEGSSGCNTKPAEDDVSKHPHLKFHQVSLAYAILKDPDLRRIYVECGYRAVVQAEAYAEWSVFDTDAYQMYNDFFAGVDEGDREYLLLNGPDQPDQSESENESEEDLEECLAEETRTKESSGNHSRFSKAEEDEDMSLPFPPMSVAASVGASPAVFFSQRAKVKDLWEDLHTR